MRVAATCPNDFSYFFKLYLPIPYFFCLCNQAFYLSCGISFFSLMEFTVAHLWGFFVGLFITGWVTLYLARRYFLLKNDRELALVARETDLNARENKFNKRLQKFEQEREQLDQAQDAVRAVIKKYTAYAESYRLRLQQMAKLSEAAARNFLKDELMRESKAEIDVIRREILLGAEEDYRVEAREKLITVMQRIAANVTNDYNATIVKIPSEDMKGRVIGREGRNIKAFEMATGATLMIDETPGCIFVSCFDPVRREIAKRVLEELVGDGRIHPVSIEETVALVTREVEQDVAARGEDAVTQLRLNGVHPEILQLLGKLHYRLSNNQNTLEHSIETAYIGSMIASELGLDPEPAKRAGLFHDMGKAADHEYEGSHAVVAGRILQRHGEDPRVCNAVAGHHNEVPEESVYAGILKIADRLSAARPGARTDAMEGYIQRVRSLESIAKAYDGVTDAYAVQAGREIRIIVSPEKIDDEQAQSIARKIRMQIENEMHYPGTIKVSVIREQRFEETAK